MQIQHSIAGNQGLFFIEEDREQLARMSYTMSGPTKMIITHTNVSKKLAGKGIGKQLVAKSVEYARHNNMKIRALCPFAKSVLDATSGYYDILY
jgi:predicted GNAT family acetyltransferase